MSARVKNLRLPFAGSNAVPTGKPAPVKGRKTYAHLAGRVFGTPLAMEPRKLNAILSYLGPRLGFDGSGLDALDMGAVERAPLTMMGSVAVIDVAGSLVQRSSWMDAYSGLTSYEAIRQEFDAALADGNVTGILLRIDSGGGECAGVFDLADCIYEARGAKRIVAIAEDMACSAAYLIGSAAGEFYATQSATVGSIGVVMAHVDETRANEMAGVKVTQFHAGARKIDMSPDHPLDADSTAALQAHVDAFYGLFVSAVSRNRGLSAAAIEATEAGIYIGADAVAPALVDGVTDCESLVEEMNAAEATPAAPAPMPQPMPMPPSMPGSRADAAPIEPHLTSTDTEIQMNELELKALQEKAAKASALEAELSTLKAKADATEAEAARLKAEATAKAKADVVAKHQREGRVVPAQLAGVNKMAETMDAGTLDATLAAWPVQTHAKPAGADVPEQPAPSGDALSQLNAKAAALRVAHPSMTGPDAFTAACQQNSSLYREYRKTQLAAARAGR